MGRVENCVEPFFGGGAWTIACPLDPFPIRTVNDIDGMVSNFWRAVQAEPDDVARWCDWPVDEARMHAVHLWLISRAQFRARIVADIDYYDAKIAGLWVWGLCAWIGSGWCDSKNSTDEESYRGYVEQIAAGNLDAERVEANSQQLSHLGDPGQGVNRPSQQLSHLGNAGNNGVMRIFNKADLYDYFNQIQSIMRGVRVCCGDWTRVCGPTPTVKNGVTAVFLDPPYSAEADRDESLYAHEDFTVAHDVRKWALEWGNDKRMRIALCGYAGEHDDEMIAAGWDLYQWKASGGYGSQGNGRGRDNAKREVIWFSPHCNSGQARLL